MTTQAVKSRRRRIVGVVVSDKMQKTVVVNVVRQVKHPIYSKYFKKQEKFKAHDENEACSVGDLVELIESKPISKEKKFRVTKILEKGKVLEIHNDDAETKVG